MVGNQWLSVEGTPFEYDAGLNQHLARVQNRVRAMREVGKLSSDSLRHLSQLFRIKNIYHSNAIEGNLLDQGETHLVVQEGLTISGKSLRDQAEARNLAQALTYLEDLAQNDRPVSQTDVRQIHKLILTDINDEEAGSYRRVKVKISGSAYEPPQPESVAPQMTDFSDWLLSVTQNLEEEDPIVAACAAHAWFAQIHPFIDGNGRTARIIMNLVLMKKGYPIAIIEKEERARYYDALEESQIANLSPLLYLVAESIEDSLEAYELAAEDERKRGEWIAEIADRMAVPERTRQTNDYEVWYRAMDLFREHFRVVAEQLDEAAQGLYRVYFKEFGKLELNKYLSLRLGQPARRTWFFRIDFVKPNFSARYLFFFGFGSYDVRATSPVTLHIAREDPPGSFYYVLLRDLTSPDTLSFVEIGYDIKTERFRCVTQEGRLYKANVEKTAQDFIRDVARIHFGA